MSEPNYLTVAENFFGVDLKSACQVKNIFLKLTQQEYEELTGSVNLFEGAWMPSDDEKARTKMHIGRAEFCMVEPYEWLPRFNDPLSQMPLANPNRVLRHLLYLPCLSLWIPPTPKASYPYMDLSESFLCKLFSSLATLRPFVKDGSLMLVPDQFYADVCGWKEDTYNNPSEMLQLARSEAKNPALRSILERIERFDEKAENMCSESSFLSGLNNRQAISYINPLNQINEDIAVQAIIGSSTLSANEIMHDLLSNTAEPEV